MTSERRRTRVEIDADNRANLERAKQNPNRWVLYLPEMKTGGTNTVHLKTLGLKTRAINSLTHIKWEKETLNFTPSAPPVVTDDLGTIIVRFLKDARNLQDRGIPVHVLIAEMRGTK